MEDDAPAIYGLEFQARSLTSQAAEQDAIRFLVGTQSLRSENQVHLIDFDEENNVINKNVFLHTEGEIWDISSSPLDKNILATCYNKRTGSTVDTCGALWKMPTDFDSSASDESSTNVNPLQLLSYIPVQDLGDPKSILWHPSGESSEIIALTDSHILHCDTESEVRIMSSIQLDAKRQKKFTAASWNPHHSSKQIATANDQCIRGWDLRMSEPAYVIESAHGQLVRDLDFNPNKQYYLASCGDDCKAKFWDVRNTSQCVKTLTDHSHWIWSIEYNDFHDQLVLTSSSDSRVMLTNVASISSEPFGCAIDEEEECSDHETSGVAEASTEAQDNQYLTDGVVCCYDEHEDSVYAAVWSTADPWINASLSNDGRLVINRVPRQLKYQILL